MPSEHFSVTTPSVVGLTESTQRSVVADTEKKYSVLGFSDVICACVSRVERVVILQNSFVQS